MVMLDNVGPSEMDCQRLSVLVHRVQPIAFELYQDRSVAIDLLTFLHLAVVTGSELKPTTNGDV